MPVGGSRNQPSPPPLPHFFLLLHACLHRGGLRRQQTSNSSKKKKIQIKSYNTSCIFGLICCCFLKSLTILRLMLISLFFVIILQPPLCTLHLVLPCSMPTFPVIINTIAHYLLSHNRPLQRPLDPCLVSLLFHRFHIPFPFLFFLQSCLFRSLFKSILKAFRLHVLLPLPPALRFTFGA